MDSDAAIQQAVQLGLRQGLESLSGVQRQIFAISESERYCDNEGIGGLIHRYGVLGVRTFAEAFDAVGAAGIARALRALPQDEPIPESLLARATTLITERRGYTYESLEALMQQGNRKPRSNEAKSSNGYCPNCSTLIPTATAFCPHCHAQFGDAADWQVLTEEEFGARSHANPLDGTRWFLVPFIWVLANVIGIWVWLSVNSYLVTFCPAEKVRTSRASADQTCDWDLWVFFVRDMSCVSLVAFFVVTACAILAPTNKRAVAFKVAAINGVLGVFFIAAQFKPWVMVGSHRVTVGVTFLVALFLAAMFVKRQPVAEVPAIGRS